MKTFILGVITGALASLVGAYMSFLFEKLRDRETNKDILEAFKEEVISNLEMLSANSKELEAELDGLNDGQTERLPVLTPFYMPTWDILKTHIPKALAKKDTFRHIALTMHLILTINEHMRSREHFKINGISTGHYSDNLKQRDENILTLNERLLKRFLEIRDELSIQFKFSSPSKTLTAINKQYEKDKLTTAEGAQA